MKTNTIANEYETAANDFLARNGLKFRATLSDSKSPAWAKEGEETGHHYRVTISRHRLPDMMGDESDLDFVRRVGIERVDATRLVFDFWGSIADARKLKTATARNKELEKSISLQEYQLSPIQNHGYARNELSSQNAANMREHLADLKARLDSVKVELSDSRPSAYDVLACISGDACTPETFADFCAEYGYETDSIKALQTFRRVDRFAKRLRAFFTESELQELAEIN